MLETRFGVVPDGRVQPRIEAMHRAALEASDCEAAWQIGLAIGSDQRQRLPVIARCLGPGARAELLSFTLSDYAAINGQSAPCVVAAALTAFLPAAPTITS